MATLSIELPEEVLTSAIDALCWKANFRESDPAEKLKAGTDQLLKLVRKVITAHQREQAIEQSDKVLQAGFEQIEATLDLAADVVTVSLDDVQIETTDAPEPGEAI